MNRRNTTHPKPIVKVYYPQEADGQSTVHDKRLSKVLTSISEWTKHYLHYTVSGWTEHFTNDKLME